MTRCSEIGTSARFPALSRLQAALFCLLGFTSLWLDAAPFQSAVFIDTHNVGTLSLSDPLVFNNGVRGGLTLSGNMAGSYPPVRTDHEFRWVQLIQTSHPLSTTNAPNTPYFDPGEQDVTGDLEPFYWNTPLRGLDGNNYPAFHYKNQQINNGEGINFFDQPKRLLSDRPVNWLAELNLVTWRTGSSALAVIWSGTYGFDISASSAVSVRGITVLNEPVFLSQDILSASFPGWTLVSAISSIPEPGSATLLAMGIIAAWTLTRGRRIT